MRRCRIVADAHNVMRRDAVCDVAAFRFITTNERTPQVHFLLHHHSRTVVPRNIVQFRLRLDCAAVELGGLSQEIAQLKTKKLWVIIVLGRLNGAGLQVGAQFPLPYGAETGLK